MKETPRRSPDLLELEEVIRRVKPFSRHFAGVRPIAVEKIVGTEGRARDFDRGFTPRRRDVADRMRRVAGAFPDDAFPPIVVYQLGDAYFVIDGHHRVALARRNGVEQIDAEVTELRSAWTLPADADRALIIHIEQQRWFEEASGLSEAQPALRIELSRTADYIQLLENVQIHGYHLMMERDRVLARSEIASDWYERVYAPVVDGLRRSGTHAEWTDGDRFLELYRTRRDRYAERGCPSLTEIVADDPVGTVTPWWSRWWRGRRSSKT